MKMFRFTEEQLAEFNKRIGTVRKVNLLDGPKEGNPEPPISAKKLQNTTEHYEQCLIVDWWDEACHSFGLPHYALHSVPNAAKRSIRLASFMRAEGMRAGVPDLFLDVPRGRFHGFRLEMKAGTGRLTDEQRKFLDHYRAHGYAARVCYCAAEAIECIKDYLGGRYEQPECAEEGRVARRVQGKEKAGGSRAQAA